MQTLEQRDDFRAIDEQRAIDVGLDRRHVRYQHAFETLRGVAHRRPENAKRDAMGRQMVPERFGIAAPQCQQLDVRGALGIVDLAAHHHPVIGGIVAGDLLIGPGDVGFVDGDVEAQRAIAGAPFGQIG